VGFGLTWLAAPTAANGVFTLGEATDSFNVDVLLADRTELFSSGWNGTDLTKNGLGTLTLSAANTYTGVTQINAGTLQTGVNNAFAQSASVLVENGGRLDLNGFSQTANALSGAGEITLGSAILTANNVADTTFSGAVTGTGSLIKEGTGALTLSGASSYSGGTQIVNGELTIMNGQALGTGTVTNAATLNLDFNTGATLVNTLSGGTVLKTGSDTLVLTGLNSAVGSIGVQGGTLTLGQNGMFTTDDYLTSGGAATSLGGSSQLTVNKLFTQAANSTLNINVGSLIQPAIAAANAVLGGTLNITGLSGVEATLASQLTSTLVTLIHTTNGVTGNFGSTDFAGVTSTMDYVTLSGKTTTNGQDYNIGFGLSWFAGNTAGLGTFTLSAPTDAFNVDEVLTTQGSSLTGWDGNSLIKAGAGAGAGKLTLSADNTYTGGTTLNMGTLSISSDANLGDATGILTLNSGTLETTQSMAMSRPVAVLGQGNLLVDHNTRLSMSSVLSGAGQLTKTGVGSLNLTGDGNNFTGNLQVESGLVSANGVLGSTVDVESTGTLGGTGTIGALNVEPGATVAPGNSIGTLHVKGNSTFASGSIYQVEINSQGESDMLHINGMLTINGGTVNVLSAPGDYSSIKSYTIINTTAGVDGKFSGLNTELAFLTPTLEYDLYNVYLQFKRNDVNFGDFAASHNQRAAAQGSQSLGAGNRLYDSLAALPNDRGIIRHALDQLSGEFYASLKSALIEDDHFARDAANERLRFAFNGLGAKAQQVMVYDDNGTAKLDKANTERTAFWGNAYGGWGRQDGDDNAAAMKRDTGGVILGGDAPVATWRVGALAGIGRSSFNVDPRDSAGNSNNYSLGVYAGTKKDNLSVRSALIYTRNNISTSRSVNFPSYNDSLSADYSANGLQAFGEVGYAFHADNTVFEPFNNLASIILRTGSFNETGTESALHADGQTTNVTFNTVGIRVANDFSIHSVNLTTSGMLGWRHAFGSTTPESTQNFVGGTDFTVKGTPIARDAALVGVGVDMAINSQAVLVLSYQGQLAENSHENSIRATLNWKF
jgi:outer membrane autotransporter protein